MKKIILKLLSLSLFISSINIGYIRDVEAKKEEIFEKAEVIPEAKILNEDVSLRTDSSKEFIMSDRSSRVVLYGEPVHYQDENGIYEEYDNSLVDEETDDATIYAMDEYQVNGYGNRKSDTKMKFSKKAHPTNMVSIGKGKYKITFGVEGIINRNKAYVENGSETNDPVTSVLNRLHSRIVYPEVFEHCDMEYIAGPDTIKENIILHEYAGKNTFTFNYRLNNMNMKMNDDGSIAISDNDTGECIYSIPKPVMYDGMGNYSEDLYYEISQKQNKYTVTITVSEEYLKDKDTIYPVIIDPVIKTETIKSAINTTFITSSKPNTNHSNKFELLVGKESSEYGNCRTLIRFALPEVNRGDMIVKAEMKIVNYQNGFYASSTPDLQINANMITSAWNNTTVTWNTCPSYDSTVLDYTHLTRMTGAIRKVFDITSAVKGWYDGTVANNGIMLKSYNEGGTYANTGVKGYFVPERYYSNTQNYPYIELTYINNKGYESYNDYMSIETGKHGYASVNNYSGNLIVNHHDAITPGTNLTAGVGHIFNNYMANRNVSHIGPMAGNGWKLTCQQTVRPSSDYGLTGEAATKYPYVYMDEDGTEHYFVSHEGKYIDEDGLNLELTAEVSGYTLKDSNGNRLQFNADGCITSITDSNNNTITVGYKAGTNIISDITDPAGDKITLTSDAGGMLTGIVDSQGKTVSYAYSGGRLTQITYADASSTSYSYDGEGAITRITGEDGMSTLFTYTSLSKGKRVASVQERNTGNVQGQTILYDYSEYNITKIKSGGPDSRINTADDVTTVLAFDNAGRKVSSYIRTEKKNLGGSVRELTSSKPDESNSDISKLNRVVKSSSLSKSVNNLIINHGIEEEHSWTSSASVGQVSFRLCYSGEDHYHGNKSFKAEVMSSSPLGRGRCYQDIKVKPSTTYTFSAYVKAIDIVPVATSSGAGACLIAYINAPSMPTTSDPEAADYISEYLTGTTDTSCDNGWRRLSVTFTTPSDVNYVRINAAIRGATGTAFFDAFQLEEGEVANPYNIIENGSMEITEGSYPKGWIRVGTSGSDALTQQRRMTGNNAVVFKADAGATKEYEQVIPVSGSKKDTYIVSGFAYGKGFRTDNLRRLFQIGIRIIYDDGSVAWKNALNFNTSINGWQFGAKAFDLDDNEDNSRVPTHIIITLRCYRQANDTYFDDIQLIRKRMYIPEYDDAGKMTGDSEGYELVYSGDDIISKKDSQGITTTYEYDSNHNVTRTVTDNTQIREYTYDSYGNLTGSKDSASGYGKAVEKNYVYSQDGKYSLVYRDTDGRETVNSYDTVTGNLLSTTDANGNTISYSYNENNQLTGASKGNHQVQAVYDSKGSLTEIKHGATVYGYEYNSFGNVSGLKIGNSVIESNSYSPENGLMNRRSYSNGYYEGYEYDELYNVTGYYENGVLSEKKVYDTMGNLIKIIDYKINREYRYYYSTRNNVIRFVVLDLNKGRLDNREVYASEYEYDEADRETAYNTYIDGMKMSNTKEYGADGRITEEKIDHSKAVSYSYDAMKRVSSKQLNTSSPVTTSYEYMDSGRGNNHTTYIISKETQQGRERSYVYDGIGNITRISSEDGNIEYFYDEYSQLIRENNPVINKTILYTYDSRSNLLRCEEYPYTEGEVGTATKITNLQYDNSSNPDQLTSYNNQTISYDSIGNPLSYKGYAMSYSGRKLMSMTKAGMQISFSYGSDMIRKTKTVNGSVISYDYDGKQLVHEKRSGYDLYYSYDSGGNPVKITRKTGSTKTEYYLGTNMLGDIEYIYGSSGNMLAKYIYDSWGNTLRIEDATGNEITSTSHIAIQNPLRYRGYYYDSETGLYYLQTRYYDPEVKRFINADDVLNIGISKELGNYNLYTYCDNNPILYQDKDGRFGLIGYGVVSGLISAGVNALTGLVTHSYDDMSAGQIAVDVASGFVSGFASSTMGAGNMVANVVSAVGILASYTGIVCTSDNLAKDTISLLIDTFPLPAIGMGINKVKNFKPFANFFNSFDLGDDYISQVIVDFSFGSAKDFGKAVAISKGKDVIYDYYNVDDYKKSEEPQNNTTKINNVVAAANNSGYIFFLR